MGGVLRKTGSFCGEMYLTKENPYTNVERRTGSPGFGRARRTKKDPEDGEVMCGICGFTGGTADGGEELIRRMTELIAYRGPDSSGFFSEGPEIHMGFRRLAIIDLKAGDQPVYNEDKTLVLTFNGEIYNYRKLREELLARGHFFYTDTDSEVLVHGYEEWGEDMLLRLRGMFAFALWDTREQSLFFGPGFLRH